MSMPNVAPPAEVKEQLLEQQQAQKDGEQSLEEYDEEQARLMEERCILVHPNDEAYGEASKKECHLMNNILPPRNLLHRAFSVFLFNSTTGKLLLQRRAIEKITFPGMWTNTCCSHPLSIKGETEIPGQMGVRRAASRKLEHELGIPTSKTGPEQFTYLTRIHYLAPSDGLWGEHEVDYILFTTLDTEHADNPNEVMDSCYVSKEELQAMFEDPALTFTPWFKLIARDFLFGWWDKLLASPRTADGRLDARCAEFRALEDDKVWKM